MISKTILDLDSKKLRKYFMQSSVYFPSYLPSYMDFSDVLRQADKLLTTTKGKTLSINDIEKHKKGKHNFIKYTSSVNYTFNINKNSKYSWRKITLLNPIVYVDLVNVITKNWDKLVDRFKLHFPGIKNINDINEIVNCNGKGAIKTALGINKHINCVSIPTIPTSMNVNNLSVNKINRLAIGSWLHRFEHGTMDMALRYKYCMKTDISNCYGSIYTHSIAWALMGKHNAKNYTSNKFLGNLLDSKIRNSQNGQTNGIPQSNDICNLLAEIVLGYCDRQLFLKIKHKYHNSFDYHIIRYRDDYRIFSDSKLHVELITEELSNVLSDMNMSLNSDKTGLITDMILGSLKPDKIYWISKENYESNLCIRYELPKKLLLIKILSKEYPNSGSLSKALSKLYKELLNCSGEIKYIRLSLNILSTILINNPNPRCSTLCISIINTLLNHLKNNNFKIHYINVIINRLKAIDNSSFSEIWLQRIPVFIDSDYNYKFRLCLKVKSICKYIENVANKISNVKYNNFYDIVNSSDIIFRSNLNLKIFSKNSNINNVFKDHKIWNNSWIDGDRKFIEDIVNIKELMNLKGQIPLKDINPYGY